MTGPKLLEMEQKINSKDDCPFCNVLKNDTKKQIIKKGKLVTAIYKLSRGRNVNFLIVSNSHIENLKHFNKPEDFEIMNEIIQMANELSNGRDWSLCMNNGKNSKQTVFHLHAHINSDEHTKTWGLM